MSLQLITTPGGLIALVVRNHLIIHGDTAEDSGVMVQTAADNLSTARQLMAPLRFTATIDSGERFLRKATDRASAKTNSQPAMAG